jgi:hypothetical protein
MRSHLHRVLVSTGLAAATLLGISSSSFAQVRDHRHNQPAAEAGPRDAPPPPREERHEARREGFVWLGGRWDWSRRDHRWDWIPGHWERERRGQRWREAKWERRGDEWALIDGGWIRAEVRPTQAPPPPREERFEARPGFTWVRGRWDWRDGNWAWIDGHWERERAGKRWREARWELHDGGEYVLVDGDWIDAPISRYPTQAPPPPREERFAARAGFVWVRGRWDWRDGNWQWVSGHWERERAAQHWNEGRWELRGDHWEWIEGGWGEVPAYPPLDQPPPAPPREDLRPPPGRVVIPGHWRWENGRYAWTPSAYAAAVPGKHYQAGQWLQREGHWIWTNGNWVDDAYPPPAAGPSSPPPGSGPSSPPPPPREERVEARAGFVWVRGRYDWRNNQYEWIPGHWERQRARQTWYDGRWEQRGNFWIYVEGGWR